MTLPTLLSTLICMFLCMFHTTNYFCLSALSCKNFLYFVIIMELTSFKILKLRRSELKQSRIKNLIWESCVAIRYFKIIFSLRTQILELFIYMERRFKDLQLSCCVFSLTRRFILPKQLPTHSSKNDICMGPPNQSNWCPNSSQPLRWSILLIKP